MHHVHCKLPNASHKINGVAFRAHEEGGVITADPVDGETAAKFAKIPGYVVIDLDAPRKVGRPRKLAAPADAVDES